MKNLCTIFIFILSIAGLMSCLINSENTENEPNNSFAKANHILLDADDGVQGSIDPADDEDFFLFDGLAGETYTVTAECNSSSLNLVITVYNEAEEVVDTADLNPASGDETIEFIASADGLFYIRITSSGGLSTGDYVVSVDTTTG